MDLSAERAEMITIKDYAATHGISYEAVRKQVTQYEAELADHIVVQRRTKYLDDEAVRFLDEHRQQNAVSVMLDDRKAQVTELEEENKRLMKEIARLQAEGNGFRDQIIDLLKEKQSYLEDKGRVSLMLEQHEQQGKDLAKALEDLSESQKHIAQVQAEKEVMSHKMEEQEAEKAILQEQLTKAESTAGQAAQEAEEMRKQLQEAQDRADRLKKRGLWARITNKEA